MRLHLWWSIYLSVITNPVSDLGQFVKNAFGNKDRLNALMLFYALKKIYIHFLEPCCILTDKPRFLWYPNPWLYLFTVCCYDNSVWMVSWHYSFNESVWSFFFFFVFFWRVRVSERGLRQAVRQLFLLNPLITTRGGWAKMNKLTTAFIFCTCKFVWV